LSLLAEGSTIPFIARYRKDTTGNLDEVQIQQIKDESVLLKEFHERKAFIEKTITEQGKMTEAIQQKLDKATTITELEDIYLPYKPKRKTKAQTAREHGLEPLALLILEQQPIAVVEEAAKYINEAILTADDALQGARDIIAELINEQAETRAKLRKLFEDTALMVSKIITGKKKRASNTKTIMIFLNPSIKSHLTGSWRF